jgi:hypothetical protein
MTALSKTAAERSIQACLILAAVIHLLPVVGVLGSDRLRALYGIAVEGPDLAILMRHRAVLFGILGVLLAAGALRSALRGAALAAGLASVASFLLLALSTGGYNEPLRRIVVVDAGALVLLLVAAFLHVSQRPAAGS